MGSHKVVSREEWLAARLEHLKQEKEFTRARDRLSQARRELPWEAVDKEYQFDGPDGRETLAELFADRGQLLVYHFMFHPDWEQGCKSCSLIADSYAGSVVHLAQRDVTLVTASRAPLEKINAFKQRMGWDFKWVSCVTADFNRDFHVSFSDEEMAEQKMYYNYRATSFPEPEGPGISVFAKDTDGRVFHTYSSYGRGLDMLMGTYHLLDIVPKGRDEADLPYSMQWVRHHDRYDDDQAGEGFH